MSKHTETFHTCDMCGERITTPYCGGSNGTYSATFVVDWVASERTITLQEMCGSCNNLLGKTIDEIEELIKVLRSQRDETKQND
jgi:hypothetical protein